MNIHTLYEMALVARTGPRKGPLRLSSWIISQGGVKDQRGDVSTLIGGTRGQRVQHANVINNGTGMTLDDIALFAWEDGYLPGIERPSINAFLRALETDLFVSPVYSANDFETAEYFEAAEAARDELDRLGILAPNRRKAVMVENALAQYAETMQ